MKTETQMPPEIKKSLQDFAVAYFFIFRIQLENAELLEKTLRSETPKNKLLLELGHGYINGAISEFVLILYDTIDLFKKNISIYRYKTGGAIDQIFKFRRHILAHRGCNWGTQESTDTISYFSTESIYKTCHEAAVEFVQDLRNYISFDPIEKNPGIQKIRRPDLINLIENSPELGFYLPAYNMDEAIEFFGASLQKNPNK